MKSSRSSKSAMHLSEENPRLCLLPLQVEFKMSEDWSGISGRLLETVSVEFLCLAAVQ